MARRNAKYVIYVISGILCIVALGKTANFVYKCVHERPFNSAVWKSNPQRTETANWRDYTARVWMVDDLLSRHHLVGMSKEQVIQLLGEPDDAENGEFGYSLGPERGILAEISMDWELLLLEYGKSGKVVRISVVAR